ncbi:hypothetical protein [Arenibaculum sp.]|jgi:hypothetical protein|uniref:hypothetical protein n=1 Tax=Arenibaculum sp. TaxID=2865862 RepID=UPI002E136AB4|nr:hypothetical protein [Arenibaculum sp.]
MSRKAARPAASVSNDQKALAVVLADRFRLSVPDGTYDDPEKVLPLLDFFAYDPDTGAGGIRNVGILIVRAKGGCDDAEVAAILGLPRETVAFARSLLLASGYDLGEDAEDPSADPEDAFWRDQEREAEDGRAWARPASRTYGAVVARALGETARSEETRLERHPADVREAPSRAGTAVETTALNFLWSADYPTRRRWSKRAEAKGMRLPPAATAHHNIRHWVGTVAADIIAEERLPGPSS